MKGYSKKHIRFCRLSVLLTIGLMIHSIAFAIALPPSSHLNRLLNNVPELNKALIKDPNLLSGTRLTNMTLKGVVLKNGTIKNTRWRNVELERPSFENVQIADGNWFGVRFRHMQLKHVTFDKMLMAVNKSVIHDNTSMNGGNTDFYYGEMDQVIFKNSILKAIQLGSFQNSDITFDTIKIVKDPKSLTDNTGADSIISSIQGRLHFLNSEVSFGPFGLEYPSEVFINNSKIIRGGVGGDLKRIEIKNSEFSGPAGYSADYVLVENSVGGVALGKVRFAHLVNNKFDGGGVDGGEHVLIENCQSPLTFVVTKVQNLMVRNCDIAEWLMEEAKIGHLTWCNITYNSQYPRDKLYTSFWEYSWNQSSIRELTLHNAQISGEYPKAKEMQIGRINKDESTLLPAPFKQAAQKSTKISACPPRPNNISLFSGVSSKNE